MSSSIPRWFVDWSVVEPRFCAFRKAWPCRFSLNADIRRVAARTERSGRRKALVPRRPLHTLILF